MFVRNSAALLEEGELSGRAAGLGTGKAACCAGAETARRSRLAVAAILTEQLSMALFVLRRFEEKASLSEPSALAGSAPPFAAISRLHARQSAGTLVRLIVCPARFLRSSDMTRSLFTVVLTAACSLLCTAQTS